MRRALSACVLTAALAACASISGQDPWEPIACANGPGCDALWARAHVWLSENSQWKIRVDSSTSLRTYGPSSSRPDLAYSVTRSLKPDGSGEISIDAHCGVSQCTPSPDEAAIAFGRYLRAEAPGARPVSPSPRP